MLQTAHVRIKLLEVLTFVGSAMSGSFDGEACFDKDHYKAAK